MVGKFSRLGGELKLGFFSYDSLQVTDDHRERMGTNDRSDPEKNMFWILEKTRKCSIHRILERLRSASDWDDGSSQEFNFLHIGSLFGDIYSSHEDLTRHSKEGTRSGKCYTMLPSSGLGDDLSFPHLFGNQDLTDTVIDLMGSGMIEVFPFEINFCSADHVAEIFRIKDRRGSADIVFVIVIQFIFERLSVFDLSVKICNFIEDGRNGWW